MNQKQLRNEICRFKLNLFGKDVLSIIDMYYAEGFDEWNQYIKNLNKEYLTIFVFENYGTINSTNGFNLFNFRFKCLQMDARDIYHYDLKRKPILIIIIIVINIEVI